jgi:hypothetical protein
MMVLDMLDTHVNDRPYFQAMMNQLEDGGYEALLDYLLKFDLTKVNLHELPMTEAYLDQRLASASPEDKWLIDMLMAGALPISLDLRPTACIKEILTDSYVEHAKKSGFSHRASETKLGMFLKKRFPDLIDDRPTIRGKRHRSWVFPSLKECREKMDEVVGQPLPWCEGVEWAKQDENGNILMGQNSDEQQPVPKQPPAANTNIIDFKKKGFR